ncbi:MAG: SET domain-containing protein [bacterium]
MDIKRTALRNLKNTYCRFKISPLHGVGVFAVRDIPKNFNPLKGLKRQKWVEISIDDLKHLEKDVMKMVDDFYVIEKNGKIEVNEGGLNGMNISYFFNDSKTPNVKRVKGGHEVITLRKIKRNEELTIAYSTFDYKYN